MRNLATIQRIKALSPIENADAIMKATVLGWNLVVKKDEFKVGDLCVYCEIDSIMPNRPEFEFLRERKMRIRTVKLRGQISQGICFPLSILPEGIEILEGLDVTDILGVEKYEPPIPASLEGIAKGPFPSFIPKTDETRVQVLQDLLTKFKGICCYITEKLDGSSVTYYIKNGEFGVCSRNLELLESEECTQWKVARIEDIENKLKSLGGNYALQGELVGEGIQSNKLKLKGQTVYFFNIFDIDEYKYLNYNEFKDIFAKIGLKTVPILDENYILIDNIEELVNLSYGRSKIADVHREGIIIRPLEEKFDTLGRVSFKAINPDFLLKYEN